MKKERVLLVENFLNIQAAYWPLFTVAVTLLGMFGRGDRPTLWLWGVWSLFPFILYLIRRLVRRFTLFLICHIAALAAFWMIPCADATESALLHAFLVCYVLYSLGREFKNADGLDGEMHPGLMVGIVCVGLLLQINQGEKDWVNYYTITLVVSMEIYFFHYFLNRFLRYLKVNESSAASLPERAILQCGLGLAAIYTGIGMVILLIIANAGWLSRMAARFRTWILALLQSLFAGNQTDSPGTPIYIEEPLIEQSPAYLELSTESFWLWKVLEYAMLVLLAVAGIVLAVAAIWVFVRFLIHFFRDRRKPEEEAKDEPNDVREKCRIERRKNTVRASLSPLNARERIRKLYQKKLLASKRELLGNETKPSEELALLTARECARLLTSSQLGELYEKARYSQEECTPEDVQIMKAL